VIVQGGNLYWSVALPGDRCEVAATVAAAAARSAQRCVSSLSYNTQQRATNSGYTAGVIRACGRISTHPFARLLTHLLRPSCLFRRSLFTSRPVERASTMLHCRQVTCPSVTWSWLILTSLFCFAASSGPDQQIGMWWSAFFSIVNLTASQSLSSDHG